MTTAGVRRLLALVFATVLLGTVAGACGSGSPTPTAPPLPSASAGPSDSPTDSSGPTDAPASVVPDSPVAGIVVSVELSGLDQVKAFTLRTNDGETIVFTLGTLENPTDFPPGNLKEHQATAAPVLVFFRQEGGALVAFRIEDAG